MTRRLNEYMDNMILSAQISHHKKWCTGLLELSQFESFFDLLVFEHATSQKLPFNPESRFFSGIRCFHPSNHIPKIWFPVCVHSAMSHNISPSIECVLCFFPLLVDGSYNPPSKPSKSQAAQTPGMAQRESRGCVGLVYLATHNSADVCQCQ